MKLVMKCQVKIEITEKFQRKKRGKNFGSKPNNFGSKNV